MTTPPPELVSRLRAAGCVFAEDEAELLYAESPGPDELESMVRRRIEGEPLEQILGWAEFDGLRIRLLPGVFVPRQRSLLLVSAAVEHLGRVSGAGPGSESGGAPEAFFFPGPPTKARKERKKQSEGAFPDAGPGPAPLTTPLVLDLGCGSGALGAAVSARVPDAEVWAVDVDPAAVACARLNLTPQRVQLGDLIDPLPTDLLFDVILANVPYVPTDEIALMPPEARLHEHRVALDGGGDGLDVQRRAISVAARRLRPGGVLLVESGSEQARATAREMGSAGLMPEIRRDEEVAATIVLGVLGVLGVHSVHSVHSVDGVPDERHRIPRT